jgi:hypothetical protein
VEYEQLGYVDESRDPSLTIQTRRLVAKVIDNTGLCRPEVPGHKPYLGRYGLAQHLPFTHHLGYHGLRAVYDRQEKRNLVAPFVSWLNLQTVQLEGIAPDPVDERAAYGVGRGWPLRMERKGAGALLTLDPLPSARLRYTLEFQPAEPDGIDFSVRFVFGRRPEHGPARARFTWPCYVNACDDVRFFYPKAAPGGDWEWAGLGQRPDIVLGETVGYVHDQKSFLAEEQALPVGYGLIGERMLAIMFSEPKMRFFVVNAGGHPPFSSVQNPAWDFEYVLEDYPLKEEVGFDGRLVYAPFVSAQDVLRRYQDWRGGS